MNKIFFTNQTANGNSAEVIIVKNSSKLIAVYGTFGTATVQVEVETSSGVFVPLEGGDFTAPFAKAIDDTVHGLNLRMVLANAGGGTDINAELLG